MFDVVFSRSIMATQELDELLTEHWCILLSNPDKKQQISAIRGEYRSLHPQDGSIEKE